MATIPKGIHGNSTMINKVFEAVDHANDAYLERRAREVAAHAADRDRRVAAQMKRARKMMKRVQGLLP